MLRLQSTVPFLYRKRRQTCCPLFEIRSRTPRIEPNPTRGIYGIGSEQANLRHTLQFAYCCFRQDLTGFTTQYCTGPIHQHR